MFLHLFLTNKAERFLVQLFLIWPLPHQSSVPSQTLEEKLNLNYKTLSLEIAVWEKKRALKSISLGGGHFDFKWLPEGIERADRLIKKAKRNRLIILSLGLFIAISSLILNELF